MARRVAVPTTIITAALGLSLVTASPAAAAVGNWTEYGNTNPITSSSSTWRCYSSQTVATDVVAQVCAVRSASGTSVQGAVIVRNNRSSYYSIEAAVSLYRSSTDVELDRWYCDSTAVKPNSWSVCFGQTIPMSSSVHASGRANTTGLGYTSSV